MINKKAFEAYVEQLKAFQRHMTVTFEVLMDSEDPNSIDLFYNSDFEIKWRGKTVTLSNGAEVFQGIEEIIAQELNDLEGIVECEVSNL